MSSPLGDLGDLATTLVDRLPAFIEQTLRREIDNGILSDQCAELERRIALLRDGIDLEKRKQRQVRAVLERVRAPAKSDVREFGAASRLEEVAKKRTASDDKENVGNVSLASEDSPVSLRTKRKGVVFPDDLRIGKRMRFAEPDTY